MKKNLLLLKSIKSNENVLKNSVIQPEYYNPKVTDLLDEEVFEFTDNYFYSVTNYLTDKIWTKKNQTNLKLQIQNYMTDEINKATSSNNYSKVIDVIHLVNKQLWHFRFLKLMNDNKYLGHESTVSYCYFIKDELETNLIDPYYTNALIFPKKCFNAFNLMVDEQQLTINILPVDYHPIIVCMAMALFQEEKLDQRQAFLIKIDHIFMKFLNQIHLTVCNALTPLGKKIIKPENIRAITKSMMKNHQIKYNPIYPLPDIMADFVRSMRYLEPYPPFTDFLGLALAVDMMRFSLYKKFNVYKDKFDNNKITKINEDPANFAAALMLILSKIMGCNSVEPTAEALDKLMKVDKTIKNTMPEYTQD